MIRPQDGLGHPKIWTEIYILSQSAPLNKAEISLLLPFHYCIADCPVTLVCRIVKEGAAGMHLRDDAAGEIAPLFSIRGF